MAIVSGCRSPTHTSLSRLMPSHRYSWQQRWTVLTAVSKMRSRRSSDDLKPPRRGIGRIREIARTNSRPTAPSVTRSSRTNRNPVLPTSIDPKLGTSSSKSRNAWSLVAFLASPTLLIASATDSPKRMRSFFPILSDAGLIPIWMPPCNSRPKSRTTPGRSPLLTSLVPTDLPKYVSHTCPCLRSRSRSMFSVELAAFPPDIRDGVFHTTRFGYTNVRVRASGASSCADAEAISAAKQMDRNFI